MLPIILQHVRELAEVHSAAAERERYKIITPFPPGGGNDFPDFDEQALTFGDPPSDRAAASTDTIHAFDFFNRTDQLYYDYSYGVKSDDYHLSDICQKFYLNAQTDAADLDFRTSFDDKKDAFLNKYRRFTAGDLGQLDFRYTTLSPIAWKAERVVLDSSEIERLKAKALTVYEDLEPDDIGFVSSLIEDVRSASYSAIQYDFGFFDVIREWIDPPLFESPGWSFSSGSRALYGETDPFFAGNDVKLCFAHRFYLVRNCAATASVSPLPPPPTVRDHRAPLLEHRRRVDATAIRGVMLHGDVGATPVDEHRRKLRNELIGVRVARIVRDLEPAELPTPVPAPRAGYVWIPPTASVPGHWERERAGARPEPTAEPVVESARYKIAAVKCRILPGKS